MSYERNTLRTRNWKALEHQLVISSFIKGQEGIVLRLIYQDIANKVLTPRRTLKYRKWVEEAEKARETDLLNAKKNQYDKAEELITFYTFAPLELSQVKSKSVSSEKFLAS